MQWVILLFEAAMLYNLRSRIKVINPIELSFVYILLSQILYLSIRGEISPPWMKFNIFYESLLGFYFYGFIYFALFCFSYGLKVEKPAARPAIGKSLFNLNAMYGHAYLLIFFLITLFFIANSKIDHIWLSADRGYLDDPATYYLSIGSILKSIIVLMCIPAAFFFSMALMGAVEHRDEARALESILWAIPIAFVLTVQISIASRGAVLPVATAVFAFLLFSRISKTVTITVGFAIAYCLWMSALVSRSSNVYGISLVPQFLWDGITNPMQALDVVSNIFEGMFVTSEGLLRDTTFSTKYTILSFSPFPSFIDGFADVLATDEQRIAWWIPMGAFTEAYHFGLPYLMIFISSYGWLFRTITQNQNKLGKLNVVFIFLSLASFIISFTYPVRNVFRTVLMVAIFVKVSLLYWNNNRADSVLYRTENDDAVG